MLAIRKMGRLLEGDGRMLRALKSDDTTAVSSWLLDTNTHLEDTEPTKQQTALILCARHGSVKCMQMLLQAGANPNATMMAGATAVYLAAQAGFANCVQLLIRGGANVDVPTSAGATALHVAAQKGQSWI